MNRLKRIFLSLDLSLIVLILYLGLVFIGTFAQIEKGIYFVQKDYFQSFFVLKEVFPGIHLPVYPGGYLLGALFLINLTAMIIFKLQWTWKRGGLLLSHIGLWLLVVGSVGTGLLSTESQLKFSEGETKAFSEDFYHNELALIRHNPDKTDSVTAIDQSVLGSEFLIPVPQTELSIRVHAFYKNTQMRPLMPDETSPFPQLNQGVGPALTFRALPLFKQENVKNNTTAIIEVFNRANSLGVWLVALDLAASQGFTLNGTNYSLSLRPKRYYYPFSLTLKDFKHDLYPGTTIPKNFSSLVIVSDPLHQLEKEVKIYMNHPLRYDNRTFFQASFGENNTLSILQVVDNPFWIGPYLSTLLMTIGLLWHFIVQVFARRKRHA